MMEIPPLTATRRPTNSSINNRSAFSSLAKQIASASPGTRLGVYLGDLGGYNAGLMRTPTLAAKLGTTTHLSALLQKARRLGLGPEDLETLAVQRGCRHYATGSEPEGLLASDSQFSNEKLAIALLSTALPYAPHRIRCGAAMVGSEGNNPARLARLAIMERSV